MSNQSKLQSIVRTLLEQSVQHQSIVEALIEQSLKTSEYCPDSACTCPVARQNGLAPIHYPPYDYRN